MHLVKKILIIFFFLIPFSNLFAAMVTQIDKRTFNDPGSADKMGTVQFNDDGTKMFLTFHNGLNNTAAHRSDDKINEYTLSVPYDISTATYAGNDERCSVVDPDHSSSHQSTGATLGFKFADDGMKIFTMQRGLNDKQTSFVNRLDLTTAYDISTCTYHSDVDVDTNALQNGTNIGDRSTEDNNNLQGMFITNDGTKMFLTMNERETGNPQSIKQYSLSTPYDLSTLTLASSTAISLQEHNPFGITFTSDGKRLFVSYKGNSTNSFVEQYSLNVAFDISTATVDGQIDLQAIDSDQNDLNDVTFNKDGSKMFSVNRNSEIVFEYNLTCVFIVIGGKCSSITENNVRTGMAIAQMELATRTIGHSTDTVLNRLKWIRRNKDKKDLTNFNIDINFTNQKLASLTQAIKSSTIKKDSVGKDKDIFFWSDGSIVVGKVGDTNIASSRKIETDAITVGMDKFNNQSGIKGLALRLGKNLIEVGSNGSNLATDTFNITYYNSSSIKDTTRFLDTVFGYGKLNSKLFTVVDANRLHADRSGKQIYGSIKLKDEVKKDKIIFIPSGQFDIGHTVLDEYTETGYQALAVEKQHVKSKKLRAALSLIEDKSEDNYKYKRHAKIEYFADMDRSSNFEYSYADDSASFFNETFHSGALHNLNSEIGVDLILPNNYSIFLVYERNQALGTGHTDKINITIGYLPDQKNINYAFKIEGSENLMSKFEIKKDINDYNFELEFSEDLSKLNSNREVVFNLNKVF